jgi:hypothetical protein
MQSRRAPQFQRRDRSAARSARGLAELFSWQSKNFDERKESRARMEGKTRKPFDKRLKQFLCVALVDAESPRHGSGRRREDEKHFHFARSSPSRSPCRFFLHLLSSSLPSAALHPSIFLIIFVVDGKTFNLKASLLHPSLCIRILRLNVIIFLLSEYERASIIFFHFSTFSSARLLK